MLCVRSRAIHVCGRLCVCSIERMADALVVVCACVQVHYVMKAKGKGLLAYNGNFLMQGKDDKVVITVLT